MNILKNETVNLLPSSVCSRLHCANDEANNSDIVFANVISMTESLFAVDVE